MPEEKKDRPTGESTRLLRSIDVWEKKASRSQMNMLRWGALILFFGGVARILVFPPNHGHTPEGGLELMLDFLKDYGPPVGMMLLGLSILIPPVGVWFLFFLGKVWKSTGGRFFGGKS